MTAGLALVLNEGGELSEALALGMACGAANALSLLSGSLKTEDVARLKELVAVKDC